MKMQEAVVIRIKMLCKERQISVNRLATISAVAPSTMKNIIKGNSRNPGVVTVAKICDGLEIPVADFFEDEIFHTLEPEIE